MLPGCPQRLLPESSSSGEDELLALRELSGGAWELPAFDSGDVRQAADIVERYADVCAAGLRLA
jgi:hypothetical protein